MLVLGFIVCLLQVVVGRFCYFMGLLAVCDTGFGVWFASVSFAVAWFVWCLTCV